MNGTAGKTILIIDDDVGFSSVFRELLAEDGYRVLSAGTLRKGTDLLNAETVDLVLLDVRLPDGSGLENISQIRSAPSSPEVIIITGFGDVNGAGLALQSGAWDYLEKTSDIDRVRLPILRALQYREARQFAGPAPLLSRSGIGGRGRNLTACLDFVARMAPAETAVLIRGETGTGKELFARAIHENSGRKGRFVVVDCASLSPTLAESILFGHKRGAFTGADRVHEGLVEEANGGTLFLDEVAELPLSMQTIFLRVLQERRYRPLGDEKERESNFRILAATNQNLEEMERDRLFRRDLLFRLGVAVLRLPPLRDCREDIAELAMAHLARLYDRYHIPMKSISPDFLEALLRYDWPGNVRELFHMLETALVEAQDEGILFARHLPLEMRLKTMDALPAKTVEVRDAPRDDVEEGAGFSSLQDVRNSALLRAERRYLEDLLGFTGGDMKQAATLSGLSRSQLYRLLGKHDLRRLRLGKPLA